MDRYNDGVPYGWTSLGPASNDLYEVNVMILPDLEGGKPEKHPISVEWNESQIDHYSHHSFIASSV